MLKNIQNYSFWSMPVFEAVKILKTDVQNGLSKEEAERRLKIFGENVIEQTKIASGFLIFLNQFKSPLILILVFAGAITLSISHYNDSFFIFAAVIANTILGFYQEYKAEKAISELKTYLKPRSRVIREGVEKEIDAVGLVPGDIIRLAQGDRVPADGRLLFANELQVDEAILTGEALPASKDIIPVAANAVLGDQGSMVFAGTLVTQGIGTAVVCSTDLSTELGKIATLVAGSRREETPLQAQIRRFSFQAGVFLGIFTLILFGVGVFFGYSWMEMFLISIAIAVSAVPEGLPVAMTVILAIGVQRMARRKGVIRKLVAAEALGSTTIILTDKTGTLTMAKMELNKIVPVRGEDAEGLLALALLNTNVLVENREDPLLEWRMSGRVLEIALVRAAALRGTTGESVKKKTPILNFLPFNATNKFSASLANDNGKHRLFFLGAPEILISSSSLSAAEREQNYKKVDSLARSGELVLGVAVKEIEPKENFLFSKDLEMEGLSFRGLISFRDPIREGIKETISRVESAGIKTLIVTGDHRGTAEAVAKEIGIGVTSQNVLDGIELRNMSDGDLKNRLGFVRVISRVSPADKMRIVKAFQEMGEIVAMTGDGVNDAPSIKQADIGVAMGSGTEVARDVADLVLLDDNFKTIVAAVEEGRQILHNIKKAIVYLLSDMMDELFLIGGALITGLPLPLNALQILWVNFFSDSFPAIAFAFEKNIDSLSLSRGKIKKGIFDSSMKVLILLIGCSTSAFLFLLYWFLLRFGFPGDIVKTFIFASFGSYTLFLAFSVRSLEKNILSYRVFSNGYLTLGVMIGMALMGVAIYIPFFQSLLGTVSLPFHWILGVVSVGVLNIVLIEIGKWFFRFKGYLEK